MSDGATIAQFEQVGMEYAPGEPVLREIDLTLAAGTCRILLGPAGAGKTSLLRLLRLGHAPATGRLRLFGREVQRLGRDERAELRLRMGVLFQDLRLVDHLSAYDNVALRLRLAQAPEEWISSQVPPLMTWLGLGEVLERRPPALSPAERQLVAVARAAVGKPALLLADEPLAALSAAQGDRVMRLLLALQRQGAAVLLATRDAALPARYPFTVLRLADGRVAEAAQPRRLRLTA